jgi:hypothetical protein
LTPTVLAWLDRPLAPLAWASGGAILAIALWLTAWWRNRTALPLRFLGAVAATWCAVSLAYWIVRPPEAFLSYLMASPLATQVIAVTGGLFYLRGLVRFKPERRRWRESSAVVAGVTLMAAAFVRAANQPEVALQVQVPVALLLAATVWRLRAEPLVYLSILGVAVMLIVGARHHLAAGSDTPVSAWVTSSAAGVSLGMVIVAALLALHPRQEGNVRWYRQGLLIIPLVVASLAATGAGFVAIWYGCSWHTVWALVAWWAVLLVSAIGLRQPDLFGFSCVGAGMAAVVAWVVAADGRVSGYWAEYSSVLLVIAFGGAVLAALLALLLRRRRTYGFPRALYLAGAAIAGAALLLDPFGTTPKYLGIHLLVAAAVLAMAHFHRAPAWVNYLVVALTTAGAASLAHLAPGTPVETLSHRAMMVAAAAAVTWLVAAIGLREILKRASSDRTARRQTEPLTVWGMLLTLLLAAYLSVQQVRTYAQFMLGDTSPTLPLLGPGWGFVGWLAVLLAFLLSMWLVRHTARTFLFYCVGIMATVYMGLFWSTNDLYGYLVYAVGGYGAAHLLVYLYEAKFMSLLSRTCALYRDERHASTTIFTLAVMSCFVAAMLAVFRLNSHEALIMLLIMSVVFLAWSFVWLRGEMLYPGVLMSTLLVLAVWHNSAHPQMWDAHRLGMNALVMGVSAVLWLGIGNRLHAVRGEIFQLAAPAQSCSVILGLAGLGFAAVLAVSPTFGAEVWRETRSLGDWALGLLAMSALILYFTWAGVVLRRRAYSLLSVLGVILLTLYVGLYVGVRLAVSLLPDSLGPLLGSMM